MANKGLIAEVGGGLGMDITGDPDTLSLAIANLALETATVAADHLVFFNSADSDAQSKVTVANFLLTLVDGAVISTAGGAAAITLDNAGGEVEITAGDFKAVANYSQSVGGTNADCFIDNAGLIAPNTSSREVKEDIEDAGEADVAKLLALRPRKYRRIGQGPRIEIGFIAEEVHDIFPEAVAMKSVEIAPETLPNGKHRRRFQVTDRPQGVNLTQLVAPLVRLAQSQADKITNLEARLDALEG